MNFDEQQVVNCTMLYAFEIPNIPYYNRHQTAYIFAYMIIMY